MKKGMRFSALIVVCLIMLSQVFAGCSSKTANKSSGTEAPGASEEGPLYPIKGNPTLKIWMPINSAATKYIDDYSKNEAFKKAMEDTGVKLNFSHPAAGQEAEQFNLMIAAQEYPDIVFDQKYKGGVLQGVADGVFADLTELIPKYAPDYYNLIKKNNEFRKEVTTNDGKLYAFYVYMDSDPLYDAEYTRTQFRQDWLEEFNMEVPKTIDQYEAYFKKVLDTKPGVAPFVLSKNGINVQLLQPFGLSDGFFLKDGKVSWFGASQEYRDYLTLMNKWFKLGYISKDFTTADPQKLFLAGKAASFIGVSINTFQKCKELNIKVSTGPYIRQQEGQKLHMAFALFPKQSDDYSGCVINSSKYKAEAVKFINYGFSEDGYKTYQYGPKDLAWKMGPNGLPQYTDFVLNNPNVFITDTNTVIRMHTGIARYRDSDRFALPANVKDPESVEYRRKWADDPNADSSGILPPFIMTADDGNKRAEILKDITTYVNEMTLKFTTGSEPLSNYDKYLSTVKSMKIEEAIAITQKAYDNHMKK